MLMEEWAELSELRAGSAGSSSWCPTASKKQSPSARTRVCWRCKADSCETRRRRPRAPGGMAADWPDWPDSRSRNSTSTRRTTTYCGYVGSGGRAPPSQATAGGCLCCRLRVRKRRADDSGGPPALACAWRAARTCRVMSPRQARYSTSGEPPRSGRSAEGSQRTRAHKESRSFGVVACGWTGGAACSRPA